MKKKILTAFISLALLLCSVMPCVPAAAANASISVGSVSGSQGDTVSVPVSISNNPGIMGARLVISYDKDLELVGAVNGSVMTDHVFGSNLSANPYVVSWDHSNQMQNRTGNGTLVTLKFKIKLSASSGAKNISVSVRPTDIFNKDLKTVPCTVSGGKVTVSGTACQISEISGSLGESISLNFFATLPESAFSQAQLSQIKMRFTMNGESVDVSGTRVAAGSYRYTFDGIAPQKMGDTVKAQLFLGTTALTGEKTASFRQYILDVRSRYTDKTTQDLCNDILVYGGAAQSYVGYNTGSLVSAGISSRSYIAPVPSYRADVSANTSADAPYRVKSVTLRYDSRNYLIFKLTLAGTSGVTVSINGKNAQLSHVSGNEYTVMTAALTPADLLGDFKVNIDVSGSTKASVTYRGIRSAALTFGGRSTPYGALVRALYNYTVSADAYMTAHSN